MEKVIISTESCSELPYKIYIPNNIKIIPMQVFFGSEAFFDGEFDAKRIDEYFVETKKLPKTSAINPDEYAKYFNSLLSSSPGGRIIHISCSSKLSCCFSNARLAAKAAGADRISVIDSQNSSAGVGLLVMTAVEIIKKYYEKLGFDECVSLIKAQRTKIACTFMPDRLDYMRAGGRISPALSVGAGVLGLKPSLYIKNGEVQKGKIYRGRLESLAACYLDDFVKSNRLDKGCLIIGYTYKINKLLLFSLKRRAHKLGFKKSWCFMLGSTITCHTGPECIGFAGITRQPMSPASKAAGSIQTFSGGNPPLKG